MVHLATLLMPSFLSIQAQDFIEDLGAVSYKDANATFLSIQAQDFIEEKDELSDGVSVVTIPEHSSSGLH